MKVIWLTNSILNIIKTEVIMLNQKYQLDVTFLN